MGDDTAGEGKRKRGFFRRLMRLAVIAGAIAAVASILKRRRGQDLDDVEWQELPPPAGG